MPPVWLVYSLTWKICVFGCCRRGDRGRELGPGGERPANPCGGGAAAQAARHRSGEALRHGADGPPRARRQRHQGGRRAAQRAGGRRRQAPLLRPRLGAPQRRRLLPGHADPGRRRRQRGVRLGRQRHLAARPGHGQRARRAGPAQHGRRRQGVLPRRAHRARQLLPALRRRVQGGARGAGDEAHARLFSADGVVPHGQLLPLLRLRGQCRRHLPRLRALPAQRRRARLRDGAQVLQPPGRAAGRGVHGRGQAGGKLQRRARGGVGDRVAVQGGRQGGRRRRDQRRGVQREPRAASPVQERRHAAPARRGHRRVPLRALQREPEARADLGAQLRRLLPEPAEGVRRGVRPGRRLRGQGRRRRRARVAGQRQRRRERGGSGGDGGGGVVRGERHGRGGAAAEGAGLRVRSRRRGLQGDPGRRGVLRAQHHGVPRVVRVQRLLPAQGPVHRHLRLRRRRLRRHPGTKDGQVRAPLHGLKPSSNNSTQGRHSLVNQRR